MRRFWPSLGIAIIATSLVLLLPNLAEARLGGGSSSGSRGARTYSAPPPTATAPNAVAPMQRSMTPQQAAPNSFQPQPVGGGLFGGGGFGRGLLGGLLGAGLIGMLFGGSLFGSGGFGSFFGLLIQLGLIYMLVKFAMGWFANRRPGLAGGPPMGGPQTSAFGGASPLGGSGFGSGLFGGGGASGAAPAAPAAPAAGQPLTLDGSDYQAFEQLLVRAQAAYTEENLSQLRNLSTPEMASYFAEQIADNAKRGVVNKVTDVRFLHGDLSEAWSEREAQYATVAMQFSLIDATYERASGRLVEGDATHPQQVTEVWTFRRMPGAGAAGWLVSAIQQAR